MNDFSRYSSFGGQSGLQALAAHTVAMLNAVTTIYRARATSSLLDVLWFEAFLVIERGNCSEPPIEWGLNAAC